MHLLHNRYFQFLITTNARKKFKKRETLSKEAFSKVVINEKWLLYHNFKSGNHQSWLIKIKLTIGEKINRKQHWKCTRVYTLKLEFV